MNEIELKKTFEKYYHNWHLRDSDPHWEKSQLCKSGTFEDLPLNPLMPYSTVMLEGFQGEPLNWPSVVLRDANLSDGCTCDGCSFSILHAEKYFPNLIKSNPNQIVFTMHPDWFGTANGRCPFAVPNQSVHGEYNLISVWFNKISLYAGPNLCMSLSKSAYDDRVRIAGHFSYDK